MKHCCPFKGLIIANDQFCESMLLQSVTGNSELKHDNRNTIIHIAGSNSMESKRFVQSILRHMRTIGLAPTSSTDIP